MSLKIPPHSVLKATIENKTSVTIHFKSASSSSKADIWCKNCRKRQILQINWDNKHVVSCR